MAKRTAKHRILIVRDGKQVAVEPGTSFDFNAEEIADLEKSGALQAQATTAKPAEKPAEGKK